MSITLKTMAVPVATAAVLASCVAASPASAADSDANAAAKKLGSIVYIASNNVWIARGDGGGQRQVTHDGTTGDPYWSPTEADDGTIAAARGSLIVRMSHTGQVLNTIDPPALKNSAGESMDGPPSEVAISPDGKTIAWSYVRPSCPPGAECTYRYATGYTSSTKLTTAGVSTFFHDPSWIGNGRTLLTGGFGVQVELQDINAAARHWFDDSDYAFPDTDLADGELSPNGKWLAEVRGYDKTATIIWYSVNGDAGRGAPPAVPDPACVTGQEAGKNSPTWSPDSTALAWGTPSGIWIKFNVGNCSSPNAVLAIKGGASPDWSKAAL